MPVRRVCNRLVVNIDSQHHIFEREYSYQVEFQWYRECKVNQDNLFDSLCTVRCAYDLVPTVGLAFQFEEVVDCHEPKRRDKSIGLIFNKNLLKCPHQCNYTTCPVKFSKIQLTLYIKL